MRQRDSTGVPPCRLLFVAPERLAEAAFQRFLRTLPPVAGCRCGHTGVEAARAATATDGGFHAPAVCASCGAPPLPALGFACVDEAHCVSEWSHNFRPTYMGVGRTLQALGVTTVLALTATATARTAASICACLRLPHDAVQRHAIHRPNLHLACEVVAETGGRRSGRVRELLTAQAREDATGSAIVYVNARWQADEMAQELRSRGWSCEAYHAGRPQLERQRVQGDFMSNRLRVVVATVAFGMGVDKSNVRLVVHAGLPRSIEAWVQETGRAGRDGLPARCVSLVCEDDYRRLHSQCYRDGVGYDQLKRVLSQLLRNARNGYGELAHTQLESRHDMSREVAQTVLALLTEMSPSAWRASGGEGWAAANGQEQAGAPSDGAAVADLAMATDEAAALGAAAGAEQDVEAAPLIEMLPEIKRNVVLTFHREPPDAVASRSPLVAMLLKYAKETNGAFKCPLVQAASELSLSAHAAHAELCTLHAAGVLRAELTDGAYYARLRRVPSPTEVDALSAALLQRMERAECLATTKLAASAVLMWTLAAGGGGVVGGQDDDEGGVHRSPGGSSGSVADGGVGQAAEETDGAVSGLGGVAATARVLRRYFLEDGYDDEEWKLPFQPRAAPFTLRSDVLDFVATHAADVGKAGVALTGRAVARIFHRIPSPSFPKKDWEKNRFWGMHRDVNFDVLRHLADEQLETARRRAMATSQPVRRKR